MKKEFIFSPNISKYPRDTKAIKFIIIHYTGMQSEIESIKKLINPLSKVSCHYLINKKGKIIQMVQDNRIAWHAGKSKWKKFTNLNSKSLGIELVNKGHKIRYEKFSSLQIKSLINLCKRLKKKYKIKKNNFLAHSDIAPLRKIDPGEKFPWKKLSKFNIGAWYTLINFKYHYPKKKTELKFFHNIYKIGYRYFSLKKRNKNDKKVIKAFQMRFLPNKVSGQIDKETFNISQYLSKNVK